MNKMKTLNELTLLDRFLFDETMDIPEAHEAALRIILGKENLQLMFPSQTEKEFRTAPWLKSVRLDVFAMDTEGTVYNTEMQQEYKNDLIKRSRYYQSILDTSLLPPGECGGRYNCLNNTCIIMITPFDLFGEGKYCYTFSHRCDEDKELELDDGTVRIFLNTKGNNDDEVSREMIDFLHYIESTDSSLAENSDSDNLKKIHTCVSRIKANEEMGVRYMQRWEERIYDREEGILQAIRSLMQTMRWSEEQAMDALLIPEMKRGDYLDRLHRGNEN